MIEVTQGSSPLVLGLPHTGTEVPAEVAKDLNERGLGLVDTDWHIHDLYADLVEGVTTVRTPIHRYVIPQASASIPVRTPPRWCR